MIKRAFSRSRRPPWLRAVDRQDCGPSVFASIARYYGHYLSLEEARNLVGADRDGTTLAGLRDAGRAIGLEARPAQAIYDVIPQLTLPAIAHFNDNLGHFVIICQWSHDSVQILDPDSGFRRWTRAEFEQRWSGYLIEYKPTPALQPREPQIQPFRLFCTAAAEHKVLLLLTVVFGLMSTSLGWTTSFFLRTLFDRILPAREVSLLVALGFALLAMSGVQALLQLLRLWLSARIGRVLSISYGRRFIEHLIRLPMSAFDSRSTSEMAMRVNQIEGFQQGISESVVSLLSDSVMFLAALAVILVFDPFAALIALGALPLMAIVTIVLNERSYKAQLKSIIHLDQFWAHMIETFDGLRTIKTFSAEGRYHDYAVDGFKRLTDARYEARVATAQTTAWSLFSIAAITAGILWYGSSQVLAGHMTAGELIILFGMMSFYLVPVQRFPALVLGIRGALINIERLVELLVLPREDARTTMPRDLPAVNGRIEFDQVTFGYKARKPVLKEISLTVEPGQTLAIVGETGSGKSSLTNLIAGFYLPQVGEVRIDGISTREILPEALRRSISAVFQDGRLFQHTIRENITLLEDIPLELVQEAAQVAHADPFIQELFKGYETQVARGGTNFSSGQIQRLNLARALLKDAPILILDEATSNLDGITEQRIIQALETKRSKRTTIIITHRLSAVLQADQIIVMDAGRIVEAGTHRELLELRGQYYALFQSQLAISEDTLAARRVSTY